jgi:hypothetical protein
MSDWEIVEKELSRRRATLAAALERAEQERDNAVYERVLHFAAGVAAEARAQKLEQALKIEGQAADANGRDARRAEARVQKLEEALGAYRSALRSGERESDQLREIGDAALEPREEA